MRSEELRPFSLATMGFVNAEDISYLVLGRSQELPSSFPALTCVSSCQLTGGKKLPRNFEMLKYF